MSATEDVSGGSGTEITFSVKSSSDQKYTITVPDSMTVSDLKQKLSASEYADVPADRQRLIYSGRVLKDPDPLANYKIKDGNTVHMVKGAASNQRQNPASQSSSSSASVPPGAGQPGGVPTNLAAGTGNDPLAGLTGARYAGFAQMPGAGMFGPDGGMGAPQTPDDMLRMLENPMFQSQMNEAMNNPDIIRMIQNSPGIRDNPMLREMLNNPEMRRMMADPQFIRTSMQVERSMRGNRSEGMPAPGLTDTTPQQQQQQGQGNVSSSNTATAGAQTNSTGAPVDPFLSSGPQAGAGQAGNPFAALFGTNPAFTNQTSDNSGMTSTPSDSTQPQPGNTDSTQPQTQPGGATANPFGSTFGGMSGMGAQGQQNPMASMMQNPELMRMAMQMMGGGGGLGGAGMPGSSPNPTSPQPEQQQQQQQQQANPMAGMMQQMMQNPEMMRMAMQMAPSLMGGAGGAGGAGGFNPFAAMGGGQQQAPIDTRPPEEQYAEQLRQLNEMGFYDFQSNVTALRRAGGNVQGAVEVLLGGV